MRIFCIETNQAQAVLDLPQCRCDHHLGRSIVTQLLTERQLPRTHRGIVSTRDPGKCHFRDGAGPDQPKACAPQQLAQLSIFDVRASS
jgi:hypothetical protein